LSRDHPEQTRWLSDCAGSWYRLGEALEALGWLAQADEAYQKCLVFQRQVYVREPKEIKHRTFLDARLRQLFWLKLRQGCLSDAVELARERKTLGSTDPTVALSPPTVFNHLETSPR
jgi:hypothetical protein